jgi:hypothetical protein
VRGNGTLACWGNNESGQATPPSGAEFVKVAAGAKNSCAVRVDGSVTCWGYASEVIDINEPPPGAFVDVSVGGYHACGVRPDATLACWGANNNSQSDAPPGEFARVSTTEWASCAVDLLGRPTCWGWQFNGDEPEDRAPWNTTFTALSGQCGLRSDGRVLCWADLVGAPSQGKFTVLAGNYGFGCGLRPDSRVECWSRGDSLPRPDDAPSDGAFVSVAATASVGDFWDPPPSAHACAIDATGGMFCWGNNQYGQASPPL